MTIEHILSKKPGHGWKRVIEKDKEIVEEYATMLGNLCLLGNQNREIRNKSFAEKLPIFKNSQLITIEDVANYEEWNRDAIERRQAKLASYAVAVWRFQ